MYVQGEGFWGRRCLSLSVVQDLVLSRSDGQLPRQRPGFNGGNCESREQDRVTAAAELALLRESCLILRRVIAVLLTDTTRRKLKIPSMRILNSEVFISIQENT